MAVDLSPEDIAAGPENGYIIAGGRRATTAAR
jgi:hypothetical protein